MSKKSEQRAAKKAAKLAKARSRQGEPVVKKIPRIPEIQDNNDDNLVMWAFYCFDDKDWRCQGSDHASFCDIASRLKEKSLKWKDVLTNRGRDHESPVEKLSTEAQRRLVDLQFDDEDVLLRFRFSGTQRLWGIRDQSFFIVLWWDPDHQVYPTDLRNT